MNPPFSLLLVHGDGSRVLRLNLPRWIAYGTLGLAALALAAMIGVPGAYGLLRRQSDEVAALRRYAADRDALVVSFQRRAAAIRSDIMGWKALHAKLGRAVGTEDNETGPEVPVSTASAEPGPEAELDLLASGVAEEGPRLRELARAASRTRRVLNALPLSWPVRGPVKSEYGRRRSPWDGSPERHEGIDIGSPPGTPVESPATGAVVAASSWGDFGKHVLVDHGNGVRSLYGHLKEIDVKAGQRVEKGQVLGLVGSTGRSTGPHLHYELLVKGKPVDPREFLSAR